MVWVTNAKYISKYSILISFNDGTEGVVDFQSILEKDNRAVLKELMDLNLFRDFSLALDTISWSNGADFAPEFLYEKAKNGIKVA